MKIITGEEMKRIENLAYQEGLTPLKLMTHAGMAVADHVIEALIRYQLPSSVLLLCGKGNNAGDALIAGTQLLKNQCSVTAYCLHPREELTITTREILHLFEEEGGQSLFIQSPEECNLSPYSLLVDGVLGTGLSPPLPPLYQAIFSKVNQSALHILSIDLPSGVHSTTGSSLHSITADETLTVGFPKTGLFLNTAWNHVGQLHIASLGLPSHYTTLAKADFELITLEEARSLFPSIMRTRNKYQKGYVIGIAGSTTMKGAGILSALASLRGGAGIVRLFYPREAVPPLLYPEIIAEPFTIDRLHQEITRASALFIGPGLGQTQESLALVKSITDSNLPCVLDADALNLIAQYHLPLPPQSILTPHRQEMYRLLHQNSILDDQEFLARCQHFVEEHRTILLLKGAPTFLFRPNSLPKILTRGDPAMATAGSGDVLTGIIAASLKGRSLEEGALWGAYLHGVAGELASRSYTPHATIASDIIEKLPDAFAWLAHPDERLDTTL